MAHGMRVLVTGSQGTLGKPLVKELRDRGHLVLGADIKHGAGWEQRTDVAEHRQVDELFNGAGFQVCYHLAAEFGRKNGQEYYEQLWRTNCIGTRNIIDACLRYDVHLIFASSSEVYGSECVFLNESTLETYVPSFHNEYALSKYTNERQINIAQKNQGLKATILRFFNAYGPGEEYNEYRSVVCLFVYSLLKGYPITIYKDYHRVFMYVDDWARTTVNVLDSLDTLKGQVINIGGEEYVSVEHLAVQIMELLGQKGYTVYYEDKEKSNTVNKRPNIEKAKLLLNHQCKVKLAEGLPLTIDWMRKRYA